MGLTRRTAGSTAYFSQHRPLFGRSGCCCHTGRSWQAFHLVAEHNPQPITSAHPSPPADCRQPVWPRKKWGSRDRSRPDERLRRDPPGVEPVYVAAPYESPDDPAQIVTLLVVVHPASFSDVNSAHCASISMLIVRIPSKAQRANTGRNVSNGLDLVLLIACAGLSLIAFYCIKEQPEYKACRKVLHSVRSAE